MMTRFQRGTGYLLSSLLAVGLFWNGTTRAETPGVTDKEILIGNLMPYSGPASAVSIVGKTMTAYFQMVNESGGVNGRKIRFLSVDDAYNPARTVEQTRRLVESDKVLAVFGSAGTPTNLAVRKYLNIKKVPQLFVQSGGSQWADPEAFPWTIGWTPGYQTESRIYGQHVLQTRPQARVAVLYQNDDFGKDMMKGLLEGLGDRADSMVVARMTYEVSDPTIDSQMVSLKASGADVFMNFTTAKFGAQAIRKAAEMGWKPVQYVASVASSRASVLEPAGIDNSRGVLTARYLRDPSDPAQDSHAGMMEFKAWHAKYFAGGDVNDAVVGYSAAQTLVHTLQLLGEDLSRESLMKQAANLDFALPLLYDGIRLKTAPDDFEPIESLQLVQFSGEGFDMVGKVIGR